MARRLSRRTALRSGFAATGILLAGCLGGDSNSEATTTTSPEPGSAFADVSFDGGDLVVGLSEDHDVTRLNLIAPDGSTYTGADVPVGETTTRLTILDIQEGVGGYEHYEPGRYELVGVIAEGSKSMSLDLEPDLRVTDVRQYREDSNPENFGKLAVDVENVGTGPTWVYAITYREAPNHLVNDPLNTDPGLPQMSKPENPSDLILPPETQGTYIGDTTPLLFTNEESQSCEGAHELSVIVGVADSSSIESRVTATVSGDVRPAGLTGQYTCSDVSVSMAETGDSGG